MTVGIDARSLAGNISGVGNYLQGVLSSDSFDLETTGYCTSIDELPLVNDAIRPFSIPPSEVISRALGPAAPAWWVNVTLPRVLRVDDIDCFLGPNFLKPIYCPVPSVIVVHDLVHRVHPAVHTAAYRAYLRTFLPLSIRTADHIVTVSESTRRDLQRFYDVPNSRVSVAPPAADDRFHPRTLSDDERYRLREEYNLPNEFVLFVGNVEPRKNVSTLVRALARLPESDRLPVVVVGQDHVPDPEFKDVLNAAWSEGLVYRPGYVPDDDLPLLYNLASVFVYPSLYEGFGIPPLEAMQSGTPVVTSDRSSLPDVVGDAGVTVDPTDPDALADAITRLLTDSDLAQTYRERGLARAEQFSWKSTALTISDALNKVRRD
ncbi:glycosyltransferase family 4 protein [Haloprofundus salilacus]|uniref:glycosyltransferase family 4 protein n=1 Tax=Haloprofundus salilacus TaxID=2876190 RepID=UPI001CCDDED5|nr:glycosyltransferase family 1 protein [Haloprofundus salilacus]